MTILGSLILHAEQEAPAFPLPELQSLCRREGHHVSGRYNGSYVEYFDVEAIEVMIPQRYKRLTVLADAHVRHDLAAELSGLDAKYGEARQLYKLNRMMAEVPGTYRAVVNSVNTGSDDSPISGAFYLLASGCPIYVNLVFNSRTGGVQLVWSSFDFKTSLREHKAFDYAVYAMPTLVNQALFVPSLGLCSKWWRWVKQWETRRYGHLLAASALEGNLYKDPTVP